MGLQKDESIQQYVKNLCGEGSTGLVSALPLYQVMEFNIAPKSKDSTDSTIYNPAD